MFNTHEAAANTFEPLIDPLHLAFTEAFKRLEKLGDPDLLHSGMTTTHLVKHYLGQTLGDSIGGFTTIDSTNVGILRLEAPDGSLISFRKNQGVRRSSTASRRNAGVQTSLELPVEPVSKRQEVIGVLSWDLPSFGIDGNQRFSTPLQFLKLAHGYSIEEPKWVYGLDLSRRDELSGSLTPFTPVDDEIFFLAEKEGENEG